MTLVRKIIRLGCFVVGLALIIVTNAYAEHSHSPRPTKPAQIDKNIDCLQIDIRCAKTVTATFAPNGDLWRLWSQGLGLHYQISNDNGITFSVAKRITIANEKISARNENRPKIAFDNKQGIYLSWAMPREKKYTADIRFSYSSDYGKSFSIPITINDDDLLTGHSFNEMAVNNNGDVTIVWLDGRLRHQNKSNQGSAIFMATANMKRDQIFINQRL